MIDQLAKVSFYTPRLEEALGFYQSLGLQIVQELAARKGHRTVELGFARGETRLVLHDDPLLQFTDVVLEVSDVQETYRQLRGNPGVLWLKLPTQTPEGWTATLRGPDGNVVILASRQSGNSSGPVGY